MRFERPSTGDVVAGVSVALVAIPQSLAYAQLAGMPAQYGLFASALPSLLAAAFVSSRYLQTGPVALTSLLTFGALSTLADPFSEKYIALAALLAILVGLFRVFLGLVRLGGVAYLLSEPVLTGFTAGAAILIISSQLPKVFDVSPDEGGVLENALAALSAPGDWSWPAIGISAGVAVIVVAGRRVHNLFPGVLVAVVASLLLGKAMGYNGSIVGELEGGFLSLGFDFAWGSTADLLVPAFAIALVGFAEPSSIARTFAAEERLPWNANREMLSQGVANLAAGISGAFPVGGSFSRSSLNRLAGATSPWSGAITGAFVLLALPFTPLLEELPNAVLGTVVIVAVVKLVKLRELFAIVSHSFPQGIVALGTLGATLMFAPRVERGVLAGIGLAIGVHLYRELTVSIASERDGDVLTVSPKGVLWFATVPQIDSLIRAELAAHPDLDEIVVDLGGVGRLDYTGAAALARLIEELSATHLDVYVSNIPPGGSQAAGIHLPTPKDDHRDRP
ncbi:MAG: SulP family inorganic anion transporter [Actinomycetia bacterium]|nr:SulP family inorganic anion transporter [Actinomycetes bacterium]